MLKSKSSVVSLDQRNATRLRVLEQIRSNGSVSRIDIASALETSPATITSATADLISAGLIKETEGEAQSKSGKKRAAQSFAAIGWPIHPCCGPEDCSSGDLGHFGGF